MPRFDPRQFPALLQHGTKHRRRGQSAAYLRELRRKYRLGEFAAGAKRKKKRKGYSAPGRPSGRRKPRYAAHWESDFGEGSGFGNPASMNEDVGFVSGGNFGSPDYPAAAPGMLDATQTRTDFA